MRTRIIVNRIDDYNTKYVKIVPADVEESDREIRIMIEESIKCRSGTMIQLLIRKSGPNE